MPPPAASDGPAGGTVAAMRARSIRRAVLRAGVAAGLSAGAGVEHARTGAVAAAVAGVGVGARPGARRRPIPVALAAAAGAGVALGTRRFWPVPPSDGAALAPRRLPDPERRPLADGTGLRLVVNPASGPGDAPTEALRAALPGALVVELDPDAELGETLAAGDRPAAVGAAGGDGTLNRAAPVALELDVPLVAVPTGTLNHLARDLGVASVDDAVAAVRAGTAIRMDVGMIAGRLFLNTASFGAYTEVVDAREQLEARVGKWLALLVALVRVLRRLEPFDLELDGVRRSVWLVFVGNCRYSPPGFGPSRRERLDDGLLDVRLVDGTDPWARLRLVAAVLTGTLASCPVYEERSCERLEVRSRSGPLRLAVDGETFDAAATDFSITKRPRALTVVVPD